MPIYEYQCKSCKKTVEIIQKFSDLPPDKCSECGGEVERLVSRTSFQLKGTGWYATDYKKNSAKLESAPASEPKTESKKGGSGGSGTPKT